MRAVVALCFVACSAPAPTNIVDASAPSDDAAIVDAPTERSDATPPEMSGILVTGPARLSESGLYADIASRALAPGVIEFAPRWPLWSDGAEKRRWILLPQNKTIDTSDMNQWSFPVGTKLWKEFRFANKIVETRFLWKRGEGWENWWMSAYRWREDGTDADAVVYGEKAVLGTTWDVPSQVDCVRCHFGVADVGVGFSALQLSAPQGSQLSKLAAMGIFSTAPQREWDAPGAGVEHDALAYLHANCGHCHVETAQLWAKQSKLVLRLRLTDKAPTDTGAYAAIDMMTKHQDTTHGSFVFVPGRPEQSQAWTRMGERGFWAMPPIGTSVVDQGGVKLVGDWIGSLPAPDQ